MSDLLNSASLVMIPSGYKEDVVYSQIPTDGSGDLSFTRASNGTRVNSAGLVEVAPWNFIEQSSNLGSWYNDGVTITTGITDAFGTTNAVTMSNIGSGQNTEYIARFNNTMDLPGGAQINYSAYLKGSGTIGLAIERGNSGDYFFTSQIVTLTNAWVRYDFAYTMPSGTRNGIHFYVTNLTGTTATSVDICFPQINYGSTAKPYFPTTDRLNVSRLTYQNGGGGCPSLLLEKQSTNLVTYSEDFTNSAWTKLDSGSGSTTPVVTANYATSPDGTQNADRLQCTLGSSGYSLIQQQKLASGTHTGSIWVKSNTGANQNIYFRVSTNTTAYVVTSEWQRITLTESAGDYLTIGLRDQTGYTNYSCDILIWGAQLEASSYATSYIPTTSSSATRVADACSKTGISSLIGQTEGVVFIDFDFNAKYSVGGIIPISLVSTAGNEMYIWIETSGSLVCEMFVSSVRQCQITGSGGSIGRKKIAFAYKQNDFVVYMNGSQIGTDTSGTIATLSNLYVGKFYANDDYNINAGINQAVLFKTRLTNAELASLTTL